MQSPPSKRLYAMNGNELRAEADRARAAGDENRAAACEEQIQLAGRIYAAFRRNCSTPSEPAQ